MEVYVRNVDSLLIKRNSTSVNHELNVISRNLIDYIDLVIKIFC